MSARSSLILLALLLATSANAAPAIDPQFSNQAVIQRDKDIMPSDTASSSNACAARLCRAVHWDHG